MRLSMKVLRLWREICCAVLAAGLLATGGCGGDPTPNEVLAQAAGAPHLLPTDALLVLVRERHRALLHGAAQELSERISRGLVEHKVVTVVEMDKFHVMRNADANGYDEQEIIAIGKTMKARYVLCIELTRCDIEFAGDMMRGHIGGQVRLVDVGTGITCWPPSSQGFPMEREELLVRRTDRLGESVVRDQMFQDFSEMVTGLFYLADK